MRFKSRPKVIDLQGLTTLCGFTELRDFQRAHRQWVEQGLENGLAVRDDRWSEAIAVGSLSFVETMKSYLGIKATHREVTEVTGTYTLREQSESYAADVDGERGALRLENTIFWEENPESTET